MITIKFEVLSRLQKFVVADLVTLLGRDELNGDIVVSSMEDLDRLYSTIRNAFGAEEGRCLTCGKVIVYSTCLGCGVQVQSCGCELRGDLCDACFAQSPLDEIPDTAYSFDDLPYDHPLQVIFRDVRRRKGIDARKD